MTTTENPIPTYHALMKVDEVARMLGISKSKLYQMIERNEIPSVKIGGCRRLKRQDVIDWIADLGN